MRTFLRIVTWPGILGGCLILLTSLGLALIGALPGQITPAAEAQTGSVATGIVSGTVRATNVRSQAFSLSWLTEGAVTGAVRYGLSPDNLTNTTNDDRWGANRAHHVTLGQEPSLLNADTWYYYDLNSGGTVDNNNGVHYIYATGPVLGLSVPGDPEWGQVVTGSGTVMTGSIVYMVLEDKDGVGSTGTSAPLSSLTNDTGIWTFNTSDSMEGDLNANFAFSATGDLMKLSVQGRLDGVGYDSFAPAQADARLGVSRTVTVTAGMLPPPPAPTPITAPGPDLIVTGLSVSPTAPRPGSPMSLTVTIKNQGTQTVTVPFRVAAYLDHSRLPYPGERSNTNTFWVVNQQLGAGQSLSLYSNSVTTASTTITQVLNTGTHTFYAQVDSYNNQVAETNEGNNVFGPFYVNVTQGYRIYLPLVLRNF